MEDSTSDTPDEELIQDKFNQRLKELENRVLDCEHQLKDYENNLISIAKIATRNNINPTGSSALPTSSIDDDDEVHIFDLLELLKNIEDGGNILEVQNDKLEKAHQKLKHQMNILDKMVKLLKLEKGIAITDDNEAKENIPPPNETND